jgi:5-hydroxyisourate hydrolase-like protein (transthyretin family)
MHFHRRIIVLLTAIALMIPLGSAESMTAQASTGATDTKTSCVYTQHSISGLERFSSLIGRDVSCAVVFNDVATNWTDWASPWILGGNDPNVRWAGWAAAKPGRSLVITQSLVPTGIDPDWRAQGAAGAYDQHIRDWATALVAGGLGSSIIRLGHEANGDWYYDSIGTTPSDYASWAAYWARFVQVAHTVAGAHFTFDWTVNAGYQRIPFDSYYPGDDVVDIIGIDQYDGIAYAPTPPPATPEARWAGIVAAKDGLGALMSYATAHGKPLSLPEWGLMVAGSANGTGGGDDSYYVDQIASIVRTHVVAYEGLWELDDPSSPLALENNPAALASYKLHFGEHGDALPGTDAAAAPSGTVGVTGTTAPSVAPSATGTTTSPVSASPGTAAPSPTGIACWVSATKVIKGHKVRISVKLMAAGHPFAGQQITLQRLVAKRWVAVKNLRSDKSGHATTVRTLTGTGTYRLRFAGTARQRPAQTRAFQVVVRSVKAG